MLSGDVFYGCGEREQVRHVFNDSAPSGDDDEPWDAVKRIRAYTGPRKSKR